MLKRFSFILVIAFLACFVVGDYVLAAENDVTEQCCKLRADLIWKGSIKTTAGVMQCLDVNGDVLVTCKLKKGETVGQNIGGTCSLKNKTGVGSPEAGYVVDIASKDWSLICFTSTIYVVTNWIFFIMMTLAVILIIIGGATYMLSGGDPTKAGKGKSLITYALIGLAIALVAKFVPPIVKFILGVS